MSLPLALVVLMAMTIGITAEFTNVTGSEHQAINIGQRDVEFSKAEGALNIAAGAAIGADVGNTLPIGTAKLATNWQAYKDVFGHWIIQGWWGKTALEETLIFQFNKWTLQPGSWKQTGGGA